MRSEAMTNGKNKDIVKAERPGGFLDYLPSEYLAREKMINTISRIFRSFGFDPIETPRVEFLRTLSGETSETGKNIFLIQSKHDNDQLALPFDHTVPFARLLAANPYKPKQKAGIRLPWRRMVVGPVFRGEKPQAGRYRQFYQFDADIAGTDSMMADAEIVAMIYRTLKALGVEKFMIRLNNRKILNGLAQLAGIKKRGRTSADDITKEMMRILDKLDKIGLAEVAKELQKLPDSDYDAAPGLGAVAMEKIKSFLEIGGSNQERLDQAKAIFSNIKIAETGIAELEQIVKLLESMEIPEEFLSIDFSIARGLDYYTGPVVETVLTNARKFGSVFSGGRYDELVKRFTGENLPSVGASIGVDRLFAALQDIGLIDQNSKTVAQVIVLRLTPNNDPEYLRIANEIRKLGINTEMCLYDDTTFKAQFSFAISRGVKFVIMCGEDEFAKNSIVIKNLDTRKQVEVDKDQLTDYFKNIT